MSQEDLDSEDVELSIQLAGLTWPLPPNPLPVIALNLLLQLHLLLSQILSGLPCSLHLLGLLPALPRVRRLVHPLLLRFLLALVTCWTLLHLAYVVLHQVSIASGERGWQAAGQRQLVREGLEHLTDPRQFHKRTDSIACCSARGLLGLASTTRLEPSLLQLAGSRDLIQSATASRRRLSAGHTLKELGWHIPSPSIRSNGNYNGRRFGKGLQALQVERKMEAAYVWLWW